jgi:hypothetical protein
MKAVLSIGLALAGILAFTAPRLAAADTIKGTLMDVSCATGDDADSAAAVAKHDKACLLMAPCVKSGYAVVTSDLKVYKFDGKGNQEASKLIAATDKKDDWKITVTGTLNGDMIAVANLALQ